MKTSSKAGAGIGAVAGVACAACCAVPVLIGGGMLSGAAAAVWAVRTPLIAVVLALAALAAFGLAARRKSRAGGCAAGEGCGCSPARG